MGRSCAEAVKALVSLMLRGVGLDRAARPRRPLLLVAFFEAGLEGFAPFFADDFAAPL
jgi:hypothetical protein